MYRCLVELSVQYDGQSQSESEHASLIDEHDSLWQNRSDLCFEHWIRLYDKHAHSVLFGNIQFQHWICSSGSTGEHNLSRKAARWNFQFDIGKQRRNTLFRFMNTLVQFCGEHAGSFSCRFCVLDLLLSNSFPEYLN